MNESALTVQETPAETLPAAVAQIVPLHAHEEFHKLPAEEKARVALLLQLFAEINQAPDGVVAAAARLAVQCGGRGFSAANLTRLYYAFRATKDWRVLVRKYRGPSTLPEDFVQEVRRRIEKNAVSARAAMAALRTEWAAGESIPGYGTWREFHATMFPERDLPERFPAGFYPRGWSQSNLYTKQSSKAERMLVRRGLAAAKKYLPHVMRDLSQLRPLELVVIDDFEIDQLVRAWNPVSKRWQICRCTGLLAIDAATRRKLALGLKPRFTDDEGRQIAITRADVQTLLHSVFATHGLPRDYGVSILCERASAAITGDFELALKAILGVQVARTGVIAEKTLRNGFLQSGGKPWEKPWIESNFRLMHSTAGALPGQKGASYQLKPADLEAKVLYAEKLLNTEGLPEEAAAELRVPFMAAEDMVAAYEAVFARMESRHDHKLQGFQERFVYRLPDGSGEVEESALPATLTPEELMRLEPLPTMESPVERWDRLIAGVRRVRVADYVLACLLLTPKQVTLRNHRLTFAHQGAGYTYADADSEVMRLPEGTELLGFFDPARPSSLHVTDLKGRYIGPVRRRGAIDIRDAQAVEAEAAEVSRLIWSLVKAPVRARHALEDAQLAADREHNDAILRRHHLLPAAGLTARAQCASNGDAAAPGTTAQAAKSPRPGGLSRILADAPPARSALDADQESLARGIAGEIELHDARRERGEALQDAGEDLDPSQLL